MNPTSYPSGQARRQDPSTRGLRPRSGRGHQHWRSLLLAGAIVVVAVGCGDDDAASDASTETTAIATTTTASPDTTTTTAPPDTTSTTAEPAATSATPLEIPRPTDVTETYSIPDFGYSINYPAGWFVETRGPITQIASSEEALFLFPGSEPPAEFIVICLDHLSVAALQGTGLASDDPTLQDLVEFTTATFGLTDVREATEVEIFDSPAISIRATAPQKETVLYNGIRSDTGEVFLLELWAPTGEILDEFLPAGEAMIESITATN